ncbi:MAG: DUF512 domain-containing protein [Oscillospiraceae bacterium]
MAVKIIGVEKGSPAEIVGLSGGATLLSIDKNEINDMLDYGFYTQGSKLELAVMQKGKLSYLQIDKPEFEDLGCVFESYLIDQKHSCKNHCMFCFIDQNPKNMRETIYFKDDDERLSFLFGNYVTLTNFTSHEIERIKKMHISPINISVHTVDKDLRVRMLANKNAGECLKYIDELAESDIKMNCQLVMCRDVNDGDKLRETLEKLGSLYPAVQSIAAVPSGITKYREGLYKLEAYDKASAQGVLQILEEYGLQFKQKYGVRLVYPADEWYLLAGKPIPSGDFYEDYMQLENGIGMWRLFYDEFTAELAIPHRIILPRAVDIATGTLAYPLISMLTKELCKKCKNINVHVHAIKNDFFGGNVSVSGLVTGSDLIKQLQGNMKTHILAIPENMLREERDKFLDDVTVKDVERALKCKLRILPSDGSQMLKALLK